VFDLLPFDPAGLWVVVWPAIAVAGLRVGDVTLNVFRTVFVVQERRLLAGMVAGGEAGLWLSAAGIVLADMTPVRAGGFVAGVAAGTALGVELARRMRLGMATVRIYTDATRTDPSGEPLELGHLIAASIRAEGHGATVFRGTGYKGAVDMVLSTVRRRDADAVLAVARRVEPEVFAAVDNHLHPAPMSAVSAGRV
jgi:uncharacterized protein YebE (UPF0316 family)